MYVRENGISLTLDAVKGGMEFAGAIANAADKVMKDKVNSELIYQSAQLEADTQDFLRKLQTENDYTNFPEKVDNFLTEKRNQYQSQAKNAYSAKLIDQMLMSNRMQLQNQAKTLSLKMQFDDMKADYANALETYSNTLTGQNGISRTETAISSEYASGGINATEALTTTLNKATEFIYKEEYDTLYAQIPQFIQSGKSYEELKKSFVDSGLATKKYEARVLNAEYANTDPEKGYEYAYKNNVGFTDVSDSIDREEINKKVLKNIQTEWDKQLKAFQDNNKNNILIQFQNEWNNTTSDSAHENLKADYRRRIAFFRSQNKEYYSDPDYYQLEVKFAPDEEKATKSASGKKSTFNSDFKLMKDGLVEAVQNGTLSEKWGVSTGYGAEKALERYYKTSAASIGMTQDEIELGWINESAGFFSDLAKAYKNNGSISAELANWADWLKDQAKNKPGYFTNGELTAYGNELMLDTLMDMDISNPENMKVAVDTMKAIVHENAVENYALNKEGKNNGSAFIQKHTDKDGNVKDVDKVIIDGFWDIGGGNVSKENKGKARIVYSDRRGQDAISVYAQDAIVNCVDPTARGIIAETLGVNAKDINAYWESDGKSDYTGRRVYGVNGKAYTFEVDKKGFDSYTLIDAKTGETVTDSKSIKAKRKEAEKAQAKADKEELKKRTDEKRSAVKDNFEAEQERLNRLTERALNTSAEDIPEEIRPANWDTMGVEERITILEEMDKKNK